MLAHALECPVRHLHWDLSFISILDWGYHMIDQPNEVMLGSGWYLLNQAIFLARTVANSASGGLIWSEVSTCPKAGEHRLEAMATQAPPLSAY